MFLRILDDISLIAEAISKKSPGRRDKRGDFTSSSMRSPEGEVAPPGERARPVPRRSLRSARLQRESSAVMSTWACASGIDPGWKSP
jgi:hypothetical protein